MAALRHSFPLAIPAFHGDCLDVPRRLRAIRVCGSSPRNRKSPIHGMAKRDPNPGVAVCHGCPAGLVPRQSVDYGWNAAVESELSLVRRETRRCPIEGGRSALAAGVCDLPSLGVGASGAHKILRCALLTLMVCTFTCWTLECS